MPGRSSTLMLASGVLDLPRVLQFAGRFGDAFTAHAQHVGNELLRHGEFVRRQPIEAQQQPAA